MLLEQAMQRLSSSYGIRLRFDAILADFSCSSWDSSVSCCFTACCNGCCWRCLSRCISKRHYP